MVTKWKVAISLFLRKSDETKAPCDQPFPFRESRKIQKETQKSHREIPYLGVL